MQKFNCNNSFENTLRQLPFIQQEHLFVSKKGVVYCRYEWENRRAGSGIKIRLKYRFMDFSSNLNFCK